MVRARHQSCRSHWSHLGTLARRIVIKAVRGGALARTDGSVSARVSARGGAQALALGTLTRVPLLSNVRATVRARLFEPAVANANAREHKGGAWTRRARVLLPLLSHGAHVQHSVSVDVEVSASPSSDAPVSESVLCSQQRGMLSVSRVGILTLMHVLDSISSAARAMPSPSVQPSPPPAVRTPNRAADSGTTRSAPLRVEAPEAPTRYLVANETTQPLWRVLTGPFCRMPVTSRVAL